MLTPAAIEVPGRLFAIGDIHGCLEELDALLAKINLVDGDTVVFLGDYGDRGPDTKGVIDRVLELMDDDSINVQALQGNHDLMMTQWIAYGRNPEMDSDLRARQEQLWFANGGDKALRSYLMDDGEDKMLVIPTDHIGFLKDLPVHLEATVGDERFIFVHAGFKADKAIETQLGYLGWPGRDSMHDYMLWGRDHYNKMWRDRKDRITAWEPNITVVCGHTIQSAPVNFPNLICIDTGSFIQDRYGFRAQPGKGRITAVELPTREFTFSNA